LNQWNLSNFAMREPELVFCFIVAAHGC
jgi:hypothetical protein